MHKRNYTLNSGQCLNDDAYSILTFDVKVSSSSLSPSGSPSLVTSDSDPDVYVLLPSMDELDALIGTSKWMVRQATAELLDRASGGGIEIIGPDGVSMEGRDAEGVVVGAGCGGVDKKLEW